MAIWVVLALGLAAAVLVLRWWLNHPQSATLGRTDLSRSIHQMLRWADDGGRFRLFATDRDAAVTFTRIAGNEREVEIEMKLASERLDQNRVSELETGLKSIGVSLHGQEALTRDSSDRGVVRVTTRLPADARDCGALADLALRAVGLSEGDRYRYRFEGSVNANQLRRDAVEKTHVAGASAPWEWQASIFRRLSRSLRTASPSGGTRSSEKKANDCDRR